MEKAIFDQGVTHGSIMIIRRQQPMYVQHLAGIHSHLAGDEKHPGVKKRPGFLSGMEILDHPLAK